ncbi:HlyD family efflux transporter periplasmic adaptor subunit [Opitutaceae bacterium]|nr:HlyD family efflux transporter periplasmic adaptor subunit [Opitutaceae bacterium]
MTEPAETPFDPTAGDNHQRRRKGWRWIAGALLVALIVAGMWPAALPVETAKVTRGDLIATVNEEGVTQVRHRYIVSSPAAGQLRRINLKPGASVIAGETVLAVLEPAGGDILDRRSRAQAEARVRATRSQVDQAEAQRARAAASLNLAQSKAARQRSLAKQELVSQQVLDVVLNQEATAAQEDRASTFALQVARYELEQAQAVLDRGDPTNDTADALMEIKSPVSGRVLRVLQESSRVVTGGVPILEVGDSTDLEVRVEVLSRDGVAIEPGARVWLEQWGGDFDLEARVRWVEPAAFTKVSALGVEEQRVNVLADLITPPDQRTNLGDGYRVEARIEKARRDNVIQIPAGALFQDEQTWSTFVLKGTTVEKRTVQPGLSNGLQTEILSGLEPEETVVLYPGDRIEDGSRVAPID